MSPLAMTISLQPLNQHSPNGWKINQIEHMEEQRQCETCKEFCTDIVKCCCSVISDKMHSSREEKTNINKCPMWNRVWSIIKQQSQNKNEPQVWIFGYGSLIWLPKFSYEAKKVGYVKGYARRFWQGNVTHRGTPGAPGCVATLVEDKDAVRTWGVSYLLKGVNQINNAMKHLLCREVDKGGYDVQSLTVSSPADGSVEALTFVATPENDHYLGPVSIEDLAKKIVASRGNSGHNLEYLFNLTDSIRDLEHAVLDGHLRELEEACHRLILSQHDAELRKIVDINDQYVLYCVSTRRHFLKSTSR